MRHYYHKRAIHILLGLKTQNTEALKTREMPSSIDVLGNINVL